MSHYKSNLRDIEFNLFEVLGRDEVLGQGPFHEVDSETAREILAEVDRLAREDLAASYVEADRKPPVFDAETGAADIPESFKKSYRAWMDAEYWRLGIVEGLGGTPAPATLNWAIGELVLGANAPVWMYGCGPAFAGIVYRNGNERDQRIAQLMVEKGWGATMVLTEPDAGSDVGAGRTKAVDNGDGTWHLEGVKRFITNGDTDDMFENILHLVLARPEGAGPGTKGLSLFVVPKFMFDQETGDLGDRNGVFVTNLEHKMGLKASTTTELSLGLHGKPAVGWLVGDVHNGIAQMFKVIEYARMFVGTKAIATLSTGYLNALEYAKTRIQGADLTQMMDKTAPRVTIIHHPDVRRALMVQKSYAEGLRALYLYTAAHQDPAMAAVVSGADASMAERVNDLLLPIVKGVGSERAYQCLTESLQTFGGSGFLQDYPIEQYIRDAKIDSLYEGTTAIQAQDFFFRKIARDRGGALQHLVAQIEAFLNNPGARPELAPSRELLSTALDDTRAMAAAMTGFLFAAQDDARELYRIGLESVSFLLSAGDLVIGWLLLQQAEIALKALGGESDPREKEFYNGKVAAANFFVRNVLPRLSAERRILESVDLSIMDVGEDVF